MSTSIVVSELAVTKTFGIDFVASISEIFNCKDVALIQLSNPDWRVRCAAIEALVKSWKLSSSELEKHFDSMLADKSEEVRAFVIVLLAGPSFDDEVSDWSERKLEAVLARPDLTDRERNAVKRGLELRSHRDFKGVGDHLLDDTNLLLRRWETIQRREGNATKHAT